MAGLLDKPTTDAPESAAAPPAEGAPETAPPAPGAPVRSCATCSAPLVDGQDWCLECGAAQPGRLGGRPGWRAALTVLAVTAVLVGGAGAAAYAALSTEAQREASAGAPPPAAPTVAAPPVVQAPAPTRSDEVPPVDAPKSESPDVPAPRSSGDDDVRVTPSTPSTPSTPATPSGGGEASGNGEAAAEPVAIDLPAKAAKLYDPFGRAAGGAGKPADAVDGKKSTAFELPVDPGDGTVRAGLTLSLPEATTLSDLEFQADTPGFTVEIYATKDAKIPPDVLDARWEHVANRRDTGVEETVALDGKFRHVLLWVTEQPADTKVAIPEVQLFD